MPTNRAIIISSQALGMHIMPRQHRRGRMTSRFTLTRLSDNLPRSTCLSERHSPCSVSGLSPTLDTAHGLLPDRTEQQASALRRPRQCLRLPARYGTRQEPSPQCGFLSAAPGSSAAPLAIRCSLPVSSEGFPSQRRLQTRGGRGS